MSFKRNFNTLIVKSNNLKSELSYSSNGIKLHNYDLNNNLISKGKVFNSSNSFSKSFFNVDFLDKNMYVCVALTIVFYALWTYEMPNAQISWTIPIFIILLMSYSLDVEGNSDGDPVEVILHDKILIGILILYALFIFGLLYVV